MSHDPSTTNQLAARMPFRNQGTISLTAAMGRRVKAALCRWQKQRAVRTLQELDDRLLDDIGLTRNDIQKVVDELVGPPPGPGRPEGPSLTRTNGPVPAREARKPGPVWDVYQSWRDL